MSGLTADELYRTAKIPYAFNYIDEDLDVTHDNDAQGDHGHARWPVSPPRIPMSGRRTPTAICTRPARKTAWSGVAPDAQVLPMKVFGKGRRRV